MAATIPTARPPLKAPTARVAAGPRVARLRPMGKLVLLFTIVPLVELYLLLFLGNLMGFWPTVLLVLLTGVVGAWLAKREGLRVFRKYQNALGEGRMPEEGVLGGLLVLVGGVLLVTPGVLTDLTGLALLFPPTRRIIAAQMRARFEKKIRDGSVRVVSFGPDARVDPFSGQRAPRRRGDVIDVAGQEIDQEIEQESDEARPSDPVHRLGS